MQQPGFRQFSTLEAEFQERQQHLEEEPFGGGKGERGGEFAHPKIY